MHLTTKAFAGVAGLALALAACSSGSSGSTNASAGESPTASSSPSAAASSAGVTLTIWADDTRAKPLQDVAAAFKAEKGVDVKVVQKDFGKIRDDFISQAPTGQGPDVIVGAHDWLGKLVQNGVVAPLQLGDKASEFQKVAIDAMSYDGQVYGLPYAVENIAMIRNTALAPTEPKTLDEAISNGQKLVAAGKAKFPFLVQQDPKSGDPYHLYPLQTSFGSTVFGTKADGTYDPSKLTIGDANGLKFAAELAKLGKEKVLSGSINGDIAKQAFLKGEAPYIITGPWNTGDFQKAGIKFSVDPIPSAGGQPAQPFVGVQGFYVSAKSKNPLVANDFVVNYLSRSDVQKALYEAGGRPPALTSLFDQVKSDPVIAGFGKVGANGVPQPNIPAMDSVWSDWGSTEIAIISGKGDPTQLWTKMAKSIQSKVSAG